jgi:ribosomal protein S18 acetylase RimI-like enzyme
MPEELRISGLLPEAVVDRSGPAVVREYRAPIVELDPFPFPWWGESEYEYDAERWPGVYAVAYGGPRSLSREEWAGLADEYPILLTIGDAGANIIPNDQLLALADEFDRASQDDRLGRPWRLGLAARLIRRFAGRVAQIKVPGR